MRLVKTRHYELYHEDEVPWDVVRRVVLTTKGERISPDLMRYVSRMNRKCEDCGSIMRVRDYDMSKPRKRVLTWACDYCGNVEENSAVAKEINKAIKAQRQSTIVVTGKVSRKANRVIVSFEELADTDMRLRPGDEVFVRIADPRHVTIVPTS